MKIYIIGSKGYHFAEEISKAFINKKMDVIFCDPVDLKKKFSPEEWKEYQIYRKPIPLSIFDNIHESNFVFIDECNFSFEKDVNVPVFYYHKYLQRKPCVFHPDVIFYPCSNFQYFFENQEEQWYNHQIKMKEILYFAVNIEKFKPGIKEIEGIVLIGFRRSFESWVKAGGIRDGATADIIENEVEEFKEIFKSEIISNQKLNFFDTPITDEDYYKILSRTKMTWFPVPAYQYITRRMLEAMSCKVLCFIKLQNKEHEQILSEMGFDNNKHYIGINNLRELQNLYIDIKDRNQIIHNAYELVKRKHTYLEKAEQILNVYSKYLSTNGIKEYNLKVLDLGCGLNKVPNSVGVDQVKLEGVDLVHDLNVFPYPFKDRTMKEIYLNDVLEHLNEPIKVLKECYRILEDNGRLYIRVVYWNHRYSYSDPQHKHAFSEIIWSFFTGKRRDYYMDFAFKNFSIEYIFDEKAKHRYKNLNREELIEKAYFHSNILQGMKIILEK